MDCDILLLEIGEEDCCYALLKGAERKFHQIRYITFEASQAAEKLAVILDELKNERCQKAIVCSEFAEALLVPNRYNTNFSLLNAVYASTGQNRFSDAVPEWQMSTEYQLPEDIVQLVRDKFSSVEFFHAYTPSLKIYNGFVAANQIDIHFSTRHFRVLVKKDKQVQLAQTYSYSTPLDVVYFLLKICYEFDLDQSDVFVIISGLIDQDSALYTELHNYFLNLHFAQAPAYAVPENEHPQHYFTSLYNLAACVS
jgi:hypothetical protein